MTAPAPAPPRPWILILGFAAVSLAAVLSGAWICHASGVPSSGWQRNLAAWAAGAVAAAVLASTYRPMVSTVALLAAPVGLAATFVSAGQEGMHRWVDLGPVHMNVAMMLLPAAVVALAAQGRDRFWSWFAALICLSLLALQTDASQAAAMAAAVALAAALAAPPGVLRYGVWATAAITVVVAWLRPDPLQPAPEVELIIGLGLAHAPLAAALGIFSLAALVAIPAFLAQTGGATARAAGWIVGLLFLLWSVTPLLGAFPVPFVGVGMSPIIGGWLGIGLLAGLLRTHGAVR